MFTKVGKYQVQAVKKITTLISEKEKRLEKNTREHVFKIIYNVFYV